MFSRKFWVDTLERVIRTMAQVLIASGIADPLSTDFQTTLTTKFTLALWAGFVALMTALASQGFGQKDSASLIDSKGDDGQFNSELLVVFLIGLILGYLICHII